MQQPGPHWDLYEQAEETILTLPLDVKSVSSFNQKVVLDRAPPCPMFLEPNHYFVKDETEAKKIATDFCKKINADVFKDTEYSFHCEKYISQEKVRFYLNIYQSKDTILEIQKMSGDGFQFYKIVYDLRLFISNPSSTLEMEKEEKVHEEVIPVDTVNIFITQTKSMFSDIQSQGMVILSSYSCHKNVCETLIEKNMFEHFTKALLSLTEDVHRCAAVILYNMLTHVKDKIDLSTIDLSTISENVKHLCLYTENKQTLRECEKLANKVAELSCKL
jgi:hypothetical protein